MQYEYNQKLKIIKPDWKGNITINGRFSNSNYPEKKFSPTEILKWKLRKNPQAEEKKKDDFKLKIIKTDSFFNSPKDTIVWLGHASFFIRLNGISFITDPIFFAPPFFKRLSEFPTEPENIKNIDYLLISHFHPDHFNKQSVKILKKNNPEIKALIPLKGNRYFKKNIKIQEAGWFQQYNTKNIDVYFLPSKHWHKRRLYDTNKVLWGSFLIKSNNKSIYFSGDTAYGNHFKEINNLFGEIDYCIMPAGAYKPEFIMERSHISPEKALEAFAELGGKTFIPMHYGTFDLSDEPPGEPIKILHKHKQIYNIQILDAGQELFL
jgi:L-ascorbate metabolism protein UlaG (beta-lactamase superfamily)